MIVLLLIGMWVVFAVDFIYRTSHVSIDGVRYFMIFDDGMIGMRYGKNLVQHHALVWNLGDRVEGFTDPLWTLIMAGAIWIFGTHFAPLAMQILGGLICVALFLYFVHSAMRTKAGFAGAITGLVFLIFSYPLSYWGLAGMEACAICLIYAIAMGVQYQYENGECKNPLLLHAILIAFAYFLRPDGWLGIVPFFAACWYDSIKAKEYRRALGAVLLPAAVATGLSLARVMYYGEWVPNTYVLKVQGYSLALRLKNGVTYLTPFLQENLGALGLVALCVISRKRIAYLNLLAAEIVLAYQVYVGGDPWLYWRQILQVYVAAAFGIVIFFDYLSSLRGEETKEEQKVSTPGKALKIGLALVPVVLFECFAYSLHGAASFSNSGVIEFSNFDAADRRPMLVAYLFAAATIAILLGRAKGPSLVRSKGPILLLLAKVSMVVVAVYSVVLCDIPFKLDFGHHKPYIFDGQARMMDKAVLANKLFGAGKTHHLVWAGTYGYYVDGTMIDSLGKSDKRIARYPVDVKISWHGMMGVPGHAKYDFRESILQRRPDIVVERASWGTQDVSPEMKGSYVLLRSDGVSLCVKKELSVGLEALVQGNCPRLFFEPAHK